MKLSEQTGSVRLRSLPGILLLAMGCDSVPDLIFDVFLSLEGLPLQTLRCVCVCVHVFESPFAI